MSHFLNGLLAVHSKRYTCVYAKMTQDKEYSVCCIKEKPGNKTVRREPVLMTASVWLSVDATQRVTIQSNLYIHCKIFSSPPGLNRFISIIRKDYKP